MAMEMDDEDKAARITGCLEGLADLVSGQDRINTIQPEGLAHILRLFAEEAHRLLDPPEMPFRGIKSND